MKSRSAYSPVQVNLFYQNDCVNFYSAWSLTCEQKKGLKADYRFYQRLVFSLALPLPKFCAFQDAFAVFAVYINADAFSVVCNSGDQGRSASAERVKADIVHLAEQFYTPARQFNRSK